MAITFTYDESANEAEVTEGTSGTPAVPADFVTFDRAGTGTDLLVAASPGAAVSLTYAVRPVEDLAILVKCIVANKTAEADFIFITGKDWRGAAQTEGIDVTAGDGSYTSTKYWSEITTLDCSDNGAGGGNVWDDGDLSVTQDIWGVIWDLGDGQYKCDCKFKVGDASTSTYFEQASGESLVFTGTTNSPKITASATYSLGQANGDYSQLGAYLKMPGQWTTYPFNNGGTFLCYGSLLEFTTNHLRHADGSTAIHKNSIIIGPAVNVYLYFHSNVTWSMEDVYLSNIQYLISKGSPTTFSEVHIDKTTWGVRGDGDITSTGVKVTDGTGEASAGTAATDFKIIDPRSTISTVKIFNDTAEIYEQYTCNIHIADKDGANLAGVVVDCEDTNTDAVWAAGTVTTAADGTITEQTITRKIWVDTTETLTTYTPHKFTLSKAGYETLILENVTVDSPIVWHLELQAQKQPPAPWQEGMM